MTTAVKERGEVAYPEAGDGIVLRFTNRDLKELQVEFDNKRWMQNFYNDMMQGDNDLVMLEILARKAVKGKDGKPKKLPEDAFDKLTVKQFGLRVMDALTVSVHGQTFEEFMEEQARLIKEAAENGETPPAKTPDMTILTTSEKSPTGPASE